MFRQLQLWFCPISTTQEEKKSLQNNWKWKPLFLVLVWPVKSSWLSQLLIISPSPTQWSLLCSVGSHNFLITIYQQTGQISAILVRGLKRLKPSNKTVLTEPFPWRLISHISRGSHPVIRCSIIIVSRQHAGNIRHFAVFSRSWLTTALK